MRSSPLPRAIALVGCLLAWCVWSGAAHGQDGQNDPSFNPADDGSFGNGASDRVAATAVQADGKMVIVGAFGFYNATGRKHVARLNVDGSLDTSFRSEPGPNYPVNAIALQPDGKLLVAGDFSTYDGLPRNFIARIHDDGALDTSFDPGLGLNHRVSKFSLQPDGKIVIVGAFTSVDGVARDRIARLNSDGSLDPSFATGVGADDSIADVLHLPDGKFLIAGTFLRYGGIICVRIARLHADGQLDPTFDPGLGADSTISSIALQPDGRIVLGGGFSNFDLQPRTRVARLHPDGALDPSFDVVIAPTSWVADVALQQDGKILIGGSFANYGVLSRLQPDGSNDAGFAPSTSAGNSLSEVRVLADGKLLVAGDIWSWGQFGKEGVSRLQSDGARDLSFNTIPGPDHYVRRLTLQPDGKALVVGDFKSYAGAARRTLARIQPNGELDPTFDPGSGPSNGVTDAAVQPDGKIVVVGSFTSFDNAPLRNIVRLHADGSVDPSFDPGAGPSSLTRAVALQPDGRIVIGGWFTTVDGFASARVARLHPDGAVDTSFSADVGISNDDVRTIVLQPDGRILIGGHFNWVSGVQRGGVARLNADGSLDTSFVSSPGVSWYVQTLALQPDGKVLIGGSFFTYNGVPCGHIVRANSDGSLDPTFAALPGVTHPNLVPLVYSIALQPDGKVLLGGSFTTAGGRPRWAIARLLGDGSLDGSFPGIPGVGGTAIAIALEPSGRALIGGAFTYYDGAVRHRIARMIAYSPTPLSYCTAGTSTNNCAPTIDFTGTPSIANTSGFTLDVTGVDGQRQGLLFYGIGGRKADAWAPGSSSVLCVKAPMQRMNVASTGGTPGQCDGALSTDWLAYVSSNPAAVGAPFAAGVTVSAQGWFRDPPAPKSTNLSNALEFVTAP